MSSSRITSSMALGVVATTALMFSGVASADWTYHHADTSSYNTMVQLPDCNSKDSIMAYLANEVYYGKHPIPDKATGKFTVKNGKIVSDYGQWQVPCDASKPMRDPNGPQNFPTIICSPTFVTGNYLAWNYQDRAMVCIVKSQCPVKKQQFYIGNYPLSDLTPASVTKLPISFPAGPKFFHGNPIGGGVATVAPPTPKNYKADKWFLDPGLPNFNYPTYKPKQYQFDNQQQEEQWGDWPQVDIQTSGCSENLCDVVEGSEPQIQELGSDYVQDGGEDLGNVYIPDFDSVDECVQLLTGKSLPEVTSDPSFDATGLLQACGGHDLVAYGGAALQGDKANPNYNGKGDFDFDWETNADWQIEAKAYDDWVKSKAAKFFWATCGERFVVFSGTDDNSDYVKNQSTFGDWQYGIKWHSEWLKEANQYWNFIDLNVVTPSWKVNGDGLCHQPQPNANLVTFIGHSQGGALAHIAAAIYINIIESKGKYADACKIHNVQPDYPEHIAITTFGQPPHIKNWDYDNYAPYRQIYKGSRFVGMKLTCLDCYLGFCSWGVKDVDYREIAVGGTERKLIDLVTDVAQAVSPYNHNPTIGVQMVTHDNVVDWTRWNKDVGCRTYGNGPNNVWGYPNHYGEDGGSVEVQWDKYATKTVKLHSMCDMYLPAITIASWWTYYISKLAIEKTFKWDWWTKHSQKIHYSGEHYCFNCDGSRDQNIY